MMRVPTSVEPVKQILRTSGCATKRSSDDRSLAGQHGEDVLGQASLEGELAEPHRGQRG